MSHLPAIGFEAHVQLSTRSKLFCSCANEPGAAPNSNVCPVCLGLPGALPVLNRRALELGVRVALALGAEVSPAIGFARKSYFYPDLPKGYQITQKEEPLARGGAFWFDLGHRVRLRQIHLEEDAGKTIHAQSGDVGESLLDMNRCGVPLVEIVTEPDLGSVEEANAFLHELRRLLVFQGVTSGRMHEGSLRFDSNVSMRPTADSPLGAPVEIKNLNSFRAVRRALSYEIGRQRALLDAGRSVERETVLWNEGSGRAVPMRSKEAAPDYRYLTEPDLPRIAVDEDLVRAVRETMGEGPMEMERRLVADYGLSPEEAGSLCRAPERAELFELTQSSVAASLGEKSADALSRGRRGVTKESAHQAARWVRDVAPGILKKEGMELEVEEEGRPGAPRRSVRVAELAQRLSSLLASLIRGELSEASAKLVLGESLRTGRPVSSVIEARDVALISEADELRRSVISVLEAHPDEVARYLSGDQKLLGFLMGGVMRLTAGRADPGAALEILGEELEKLRARRGR